MARRREKTCAQLEEEIRKLMEQQKALRAQKQELFIKAFCKAAGPDVFDAMQDKDIRQLAQIIGQNLDNIVERKPLDYPCVDRAENPRPPEEPPVFVPDTNVSGQAGW